MCPRLCLSRSGAHSFKDKGLAASEVKRSKGQKVKNVKRKLKINIERKKSVQKNNRIVFKRSFTA